MRAIPSVLAFLLIGCGAGEDAAPRRTVTAERCDRMYEWCVPRECTGSTEWETLKACARAGYAPASMPPLRAAPCSDRAERCARAQCSDREWQYILACEHAGLLF